MNDPQNEHHSQGPVFNAEVSGAQLAWNNGEVTQNQRNNSAVAPGFEALAERIEDLLRQLPQAGLADRDREDAESAARDVLTAITRPGPPEEGRLRRAVALLRGVLAPVATGVVAGTAVGAQEWATAAIEGLTGIV
ncbi:hypothetical protein [Streptomyces radicis]|uniref:Uncharacterized protein n=1 Tax=Streptomyces radicis TaxID=1750517 RepID=A0A3A9WI53_9ACTN|nr:hypothetical protein [Streptomyces radicis]RKN07386.1 hypothetical protein D7319_18715 [Streptomyces radicis]RKN19595.1 hypothetical protein D7318_19810 [Streptomyces radicis]